MTHTREGGRGTREFGSLVAKRERKRTLVRPESRREDNIKIDLQEMRWEEVTLH